jgi:5'-nucleotidase
MISTRVCLVVCVLALIAADSRARGGTVAVRILAINDFHGRLIADTTDEGQVVGGAPALAACIKRRQRQSRGRAFVVHAGDLVGASPPHSAMMQDEPTIMFFNLFANRFCRRSPDHPRCNCVGAPGNHEFDEGIAEFLRLIEGGTHPRGPFLQNPYRGAYFPHVCANSIDTVTDKPVFRPFVIRNAGGVRIAFIGATIRRTPELVTPDGVAGLRFADEADAINRAARDVLSRGVRAMAVLIHHGGRQKAYQGPTDSAAAPVRGPIVDIAGRLHDEIDVVIAGHYHSFTNALLKSRNGADILVVQAWPGGAAFGDIEVIIDRTTGNVVEKTARIVAVRADSGCGVAADPEAAALVAALRKKADPALNEIVGAAAVNITRSRTAAGESALGNLIADAQRAATDADIAMTNPGGIRADCRAGPLSVGECHAIQPFNNRLITMTLTGDQLEAALNQQWDESGDPRMLQIAGFSYAWDPDRPIGDRIVEMRIGDKPIDGNRGYRVVVNSFLAAGGDRFTAFAHGVDRVAGPIDLDALIAWIRALDQPFDRAIEGRVRIAADADSSASRP